MAAMERIIRRLAWTVLTIYCVVEEVSTRYDAGVTEFFLP
jgi:hypothetical protein